MLADPESWWALASVSPLVEGGYWHSEIVGKFFHGEQLIAGFHGVILQSHPFTRMSMDAADLSAALSATLQRPE